MSFTFKLAENAPNFIIIRFKINTTQNYREALEKILILKYQTTHTLV